jgi:hypothetical protein
VRAAGRELDQVHPGKIGCLRAGKPRNKRGEARKKNRSNMKVFGDLQTVKCTSLHSPLGIGSRRALLGLLAAVSVALLAGCGGSSSSSTAPTATATPTPAPTPTAIPPSATNGSVFAVDCLTQQAYVPLPFLSDNLDGEVAVLDLSVDPNKTDPRIATLDMGLSFYLPKSATAAQGTGQVVVLSDNVNNTGWAQVINESNNSISNSRFPIGSRPDVGDTVVYNPSNGTALVTMSDAAIDCTIDSGTCTGIASFDLSQQSFGPLLNIVNEADAMALDPTTQVPLTSSDAITPQLYAPDLAANVACVLSDGSLNTLNSDPDAMAVDPTTHLWVVGDFDSSMATVINLNGATYSAPPNCTLTEAGVLPNSVLHDTGAGIGMPGVAINPLTHQALMTANQSNEVALLTLPSAPVAQMTAAQVSGVESSLPADPNNVTFLAATFPYAVVADSCHNFGYILDQQRQFLVQIDLAKFQSNPTGISTPLPAGNCAGTSSTLGCDNGNGVKFFPLPGVL